VPARKSQPIFSTSTGSCPTAWQASSRYGTSAAFAMRPTAAAGFTSPPLVGIQVRTMSFTRRSIIRSSAAVSISPVSSEGQTRISMPNRSRACRSAT
jgi:hypothetical protein